jgi:hypothetical protein
MISNKSNFSVGSIQALNETALKIERKLHLREELVPKEIISRPIFNPLASQLIAATEELNELADSLVANAAAMNTTIT